MQDSYRYKSMRSLVSTLEDFAETLESAGEGFYIENLDNGRCVEVTNMTGGRYLCTEHDEPVRQTDNEAIAYGFLMGLLKGARR